MPGMGKHGAFQAVSVSALCLLSPACPLHRCVNMEFFFLVCCNFLMFIRMKGLEIAEGMRKRFLFVSPGRCRGK